MRNNRNQSQDNGSNVTGNGSSNVTITISNRRA
jgi:hypothetical protein